MVCTYGSFHPAAITKRALLRHDLAAWHCLSLQHEDQTDQLVLCQRYTQGLSKLCT